MTMTIPKDDINDQDENADTSSSGSNEGKTGEEGLDEASGSNSNRSGSGRSGTGGYSADCSSSDASSSEGARAKASNSSSSSLPPNKDMERLSMKPEQGDLEQRKEELHDQQGIKPKTESAHSNPRSPAVDDRGRSHNTYDGSAPTGDKRSVLPQLNGIRITHPMDPRIDLSSVKHIQASSLQYFPTNVAVPALNVAEQQQKQQQQAPEMNNLYDDVDAMQQQPTPSIDQYMKLMEVVRPFFNAHGIAEMYFGENELPDETKEDSEADEISSAHHEVIHSETTKSPQVPNDLHKNRPETPEIEIDELSPELAQAQTQEESDSSSMVVLARVKRKHLRKVEEGEDGGEGDVNEGSSTSLHNGSNASSISSEKRTRTQQQQPDDPSDENEDVYKRQSAESQLSMENNGVPPSHDVESEARQESMASSSSGDKISADVKDRPGPPHDGNVPAVVSEYSSSALAGSSGGSNTNTQSTSGSGSGENTGSGSNQGGSSGSGNDQGGTSSNSHGNNGSSGSSNGIKGSGEEVSGEGRRAEHSGGNSDETSSNLGKDKHHQNYPSRQSNSPDAEALNEVAANSNALGMNNAEFMHDDDGNGRDVEREKKLQSKKRKRMNMRREYEEKVQQEMGSSEGSRGRDEPLLRPGRPVTLDKALSFTKVARVIVKAVPPFLTIYTNAAYTRLSGIDSHTVVGKSVSSLLSIPTSEVMTKSTDHNFKERNGNSSQPNNANTASSEQQQPSKQSAQADSTINHRPATFGKGHMAAEAAGRAKAEASHEESTDISLERLIAVSGYNTYQTILVTTKAHAMAGRNFAMIKSVNNGLEESRNREEGSNESSITSSYDGPFHTFPCSMTISPVVSSPETFIANQVSDKDTEHLHHHGHHKSKRRKHNYHSDGQQTQAGAQYYHRRYPPTREGTLGRKRHLITHFAIQLEPLDAADRGFGSAGSQSSTSLT